MFHGPWITQKDIQYMHWLCHKFQLFPLIYFSCGYVCINRRIWWHPPTGRHERVSRRAVHHVLPWGIIPFPMVGYWMFTSGIWLTLSGCWLCSVFRYKGNKPVIYKRVGLAVTAIGKAECQGDFQHRDCSISMETGDLILGSVRMEDEGPYMCREIFSDDSRYRLRQLNVNGKVFIIDFFTCCRLPGKVMFSQVSVCPQLASWILVHCSALLWRVGMHLTGMLTSCE